MGSVHRDTNCRYKSAAEWPAWTDEVRFTVTDDSLPSSEDYEWAAAHLNRDHHTDEPTPVEFLDGRDAAMQDAETFYYSDCFEGRDLDLAAEEAEAMDRLERGHHSI